MKHVVEFRDEAGELQVGDTVTVEAFEPGQKVKVAGRSKGKGFQGGIKRHGFSRGPVSHGSHNVRAPGSIGASATPSRVLPGQQMPGQMGNKRVTQRGLEVVAGRRRRTTCSSSAAPSPARATASWRCAPMADAPILGGTKKAKLDEKAFGADVQRRRSSTSRSAPSSPRAVRARTRRRRAARSAAAAPSRGARRAPAAPAPARRARRSGPAAARSSGPRRGSYTFKVNRKEKRAALRSALSLHADRGSLAVFDAGAFDTPSTKQAVQLLAGWDAAQQPDARRPHRGRGEGRLLVPQPRRARRCCRRTASAWPTSSAPPRVLASQAALDELTRRATA